MPVSRTVDVFFPSVVEKEIHVFRFRVELIFKFNQMQWSFHIYLGSQIYIRFNFKGNENMFAYVCFEINFQINICIYMYLVKFAMQLGVDFIFFKIF